MSYESIVQMPDEKSLASGYASLDSGSKVPLVELPPYGPSGVGHSAGIVPDPGNDDGLARSFREDGIWTVAPFTWIRTPDLDQDDTTGSITYDQGRLFRVMGLAKVTTIGTSGNVSFNISWLDDTNTVQTTTLRVLSITVPTTSPSGFEGVFATKNPGLGDFSWTLSYSGTKGPLVMSWHIGVKDITP